MIQHALGSDQDRGFDYDGSNTLLINYQNTDCSSWSWRNISPEDISSVSTFATKEFCESSLYKVSLEHIPTKFGQCDFR